MKKILTFSIVLVGLIISSCTKSEEGDEDKLGCIYGIATELSTAEPMRAMGVELYKSDKLLLKTVTFDDGHFEFVKLSPGDYQVKVVADEYEQTEKGQVTVEAGRQARIDLQVRKMTFKNHIIVRTIEPVISGDEVTLAGEYSHEDGVDYVPSEVGFVYDTQGNPKNGGTVMKCKVDNETKSFSTTVDDFGKGIYYVQAYAKNRLGTEYGEVRSFNLSGTTVVTTLEPTNVSSSGVTLNGRIESVGSPAFSEKGFCYNKSGEPTVSDTKVVVAGIYSGDYTYTCVGLSPHTTYYVRAYAIQNEQVHYGTSFSFSTDMTATVISTSDATNVTPSSATLNGNVANAGSPAYSERGFCYSYSPNPTINSMKKVVSGTGEGNYTANISGLSYNTTYYYKAYVIQNGTPIYGSEVSFTSGYTTAVVETNSSATDIKYESAKLGFTIKNVGDPKCTEAGICYGTSSNPTIDGDKVVGSVSTYLQKKDVTGLQENTTYYFRAYVIQDGKAVYGNTFSFKTATRPSVSTLSVSNLQNQYGLMNMWQVQLNGKVNSVGNPTIKGRGFKYSTNGAPESGGTNVSASGSSVGDFSASLSSLKSNTTYYVRAYVKNDLGYEYGELVTFTTGD